MKAWEITFTDQKGERVTLPLASEQQPSIEEAARRVRTHLYPIMDDLDLNDFDDRVTCPTAEWLKKQNGVEILSIREKP